jgi:hypothetical protein
MKSYTITETDVRGNETARIGNQNIRWAMCLSKARYDKRGAKTVLNAFSNQRGRHGRPRDLRVYSCPLCAGWHLTKLNSQNHNYN